jgi:hypothetical protein
MTGTTADCTGCITWRNQCRHSHPDRRATFGATLIDMAAFRFPAPTARFEVRLLADGAAAYNNHIKP